MPATRDENLWDFLEAGAGPPKPSPAPVAASTVVHTYVHGFDDALAGGIPRGSIVALLGGPGTMKSVFAFWTLFQNAKRQGLKGVYLTLEQGTSSFQQQMAVLGMDLGEVEDRVALVDVALLRHHGFDDNVDWVDFILQVAKRARDQGAQLIVVDSLQSLEGVLMSRNTRHDKFRFFEGLREMGFTAFVINEQRPHHAEIGGGRHVEDYLADGVIEFRFHATSEYEFQRRIRCIKMRGCRHDTSFLALLWDEGGLRVAKTIAQQESHGYTGG